MSVTDKTKFYRYDGYPHDVTSFKYLLSSHDLIKETPCGYWVEFLWCKAGRKWVSKTSVKKFAYLTKEEAFKSYIARKEKQLFHIKRMMGIVERSLEISNSINYSDLEKLIADKGQECSEPFWEY